MWIAHEDGPVERDHGGVTIKGYYLEARESPIIFDARRFLHAGGHWDHHQPRVVLIAWTVIHVRTLPTAVLQQSQSAGFPVPSQLDLDQDVPCDDGVISPHLR